MQARTRLAATANRALQTGSEAAWARVGGLAGRPYFLRGAMTEITQQCARRLAVAVLEMAIDDWKRYQLTTAWPGRMNRIGRGGYPRAGFNSPREELVEFFNGAMCAEMLEVLNIPPKLFREKLNIPNKDTA